MQPHLHIVGTGHHYQYGSGRSFGGYICTDEDEAAFAETLRVVAQRVSADLIAEELNIQALHEMGADRSVPQSVASALHLPHLFCEPNRTERLTLGIYEDTAILVSAFPEQVSEAEFLRLSADSWRRREEEWCRRLCLSAAQRIVFICGSDHIASFPSLAETKGFIVTIAERDWKA